MAVVGDPILHTMAAELRAALIAAGADPTSPPDNDNMPADRAFAEYVRRGGTVYTDPHLFARSLVEQVKSL